MRSSQLSFLPSLKLSSVRHHGGDTRIGRRKIVRPFSPKLPLHIVLRSEKAKGKWSLLHPRIVSKIEEELKRISKKNGVKIYRFANVGNHLHLLIRAPVRSALKAFLRELAGALAFLVTGARKGNPLTARFWDSLPYSRIVSWGREFKTVKEYLVKNLFEAAGLWNRERDQGAERYWITVEGEKRRFQ